MPAVRVRSRRNGEAVKRCIRRKIEASLILLAAKILEGRNVQRSSVVSRRDNNKMYGMAEELDGIAERINNNYQ
jgi:hypothetical protein